MRVIIYMISLVFQEIFNNYQLETLTAFSGVFRIWHLATSGMVPHNIMLDMTTARIMKYQYHRYIV